MSYPQKPSLVLSALIGANMDCAGFSKPELIQALTQLIDGLERCSELGVLVGELDNNWRHAPNPAKDKARRIDQDFILKRTPVEERADLTPLYQLKLDDMAVEITELSRPELVRAIKNSWANLQDYKKIVERFHVDVFDITNGVHVQDELDKDCNLEKDVSSSHAIPTKKTIKKASKKA